MGSTKTPSVVTVHPNALRYHIEVELRNGNEFTFSMCPEKPLFDDAGFVVIKETHASIYYFTYAEIEHMHCEEIAPSFEEE